jgi:hypothetical protein
MGACFTKRWVAEADGMIASHAESSDRVRTVTAMAFPSKTGLAAHLDETYMQQRVLFSEFVNE